MELPVFGTSSTWSEKHQGVLVAVNLRGSPEAWAESAETVRLLLQEGERMSTGLELTMSWHIKHGKGLGRATEAQKTHGIPHKPPFETVS